MRNPKPNGHSLDTSSRRVPTHGRSSSERSVASTTTLVPRGGSGTLPNRHNHHHHHHSKTKSISSFNHEENERQSAASKRKTKVIIVLGITLPVLACIIGIAAWAVTTDVLRITPRIRTTSVGIFESDSRRKVSDKIQHRSDQEVDVFTFTQAGSSRDLSRLETTTRKPSSENKNFRSTITMVPETTTTTTSTTSVTNAMTPTHVLASDFIKKLVSESGIKKKTPEFVIFAPVADHEYHNSKKKIDSKKARQLQDKVLIDDETDLVAEESVNSEELSQETDFTSMKKYRRVIYPPPRKVSPSMEHSVHDHSRFMESDTTYPRQKTHSSPRSSEIGSDRFSSLERYSSIAKTIPKDTETFRPSHGSIPVYANHPNPQHNRPQIMEVSGNMQSHHSSFNSPVSQPVPGQQNFNLPTAYDKPHHSYEGQTQQYKDTYHNQHIKSQMNGLPSSQHMTEAQTVDLTIFPKSSSGHGTSQQQQQDYHTAPIRQTLAQGEPQYFAPPPQNFHMKASYGSGSGQAPLSTYENVAQSSINTDTAAGMHHHHHHHHHHNDGLDEPGIVSAPSTNDADRLGTVSFGGGSPKGITLQIGTGGGGLTSLLPIGALGVARGVLSSLLPRPRLGLNSKVFVGLEVGRGSRLSLPLG